MHLLLDSFTHPDEWLVKYLPILLSPILTVGRHSLMVCEILYAGFTFAGVAWLAYCYLGWLEKTVGPSTSARRGMKWGCAIFLAAATLFIALAKRDTPQLIGIVPAGIIAVLLVLGFLLATGWLFRPRRQN